MVGKDEVSQLRQPSSLKDSLEIFWGLQKRERQQIRQVKKAQSFLKVLNHHFLAVLFCLQILNSLKMNEVLRVDPVIRHAYFGPHLFSRLTVAWNHDCGMEYFLMLHRRKMGGLQTSFQRLQKISSFYKPVISDVKAA